mmetsp:Transcript_51220/g.74912  ORF Transcript_51220/g.74912 Transcript_51220/m.74912 type:complete len:219 (+) Transcript_51220:1-657(+)
MHLWVQWSSFTIWRWLTRHPSGAHLFILVHSGVLDKPSHPILELINTRSFSINDRNGTNKIETASGVVPGSAGGGAGRGEARGGLLPPAAAPGLGPPRRVHALELRGVAEHPPAAQRRGRGHLHGPRPPGPVLHRPHGDSPQGDGGGGGVPPGLGGLRPGGGPRRPPGAARAGPRGRPGDGVRLPAAARGAGCSCPGGIRARVGPGCACHRATRSGGG